MEQQPWLAQAWDRQADVVVVGFGGAGAAAAITACDAGASVILLEKAPEGDEGGNTRVAAQGYLNTSSADSAVTYLKAMSGHHRIPETMVRVWAEEMCANNAWVTHIGGDPQEHQHPPAGIEFPELPGADCVHKFHHGSVLGYSHTWDMLARAVRSRPIEVLYATPAKELIQNAMTKEILGVRAERAGEPCHIEASKAVILTCGGFENNQEMIRNYLPALPYCYTSGTPYNEGDGITMAMSVGADLWHMNNFAGPSMALKVPQVRTTFSMAALHFAKEPRGGMIVVGPEGTRFTDEKYRTLHGKVKSAGRWAPLATPCPMFMVFDHTLFSDGPLYDKEPRQGWTPVVERYEWSEDNQAELAKGWIKRAATVAALAETLGLPAAALEQSVKRWNAHCRAGADTDFGRTKMFAPIGAGPYYAVQLSPSMLNTQGGPRRDERSQILRPDGSPIPRLYSAGELGSIYAYLYQGTGNIGECFAFGRIAGRNAAAEQPWR